MGVMSGRNKKAILALEDGTWFEGLSFGAPGKALGEAVFNTSMTGYQEILTDPSYRGQMVAMTYPHIGNTGVNEVDVESRQPWVAGLIVREHCPRPSNYRMTIPLADYLVENGIVAVTGVDTRALTAHLRRHGSKKAVLSTRDLDPRRLVREALESPGLVGRDLVREVTCDRPYHWDERPYDLSHPERRHQMALPFPEGERRFRVAAIDCGVKYNILRRLTAAGFDVTVHPASTTAEAILASGAEGVFLSNGPGDPEGVPYVVETVRGLLGRLPIFGICLGHQILGLAAGGRTFKMKFGHRGANQPVLDTSTRRVEITSQNHGFAVDVSSLDPEMVEATHVNLSDDTSEGLSYRKVPAFSVQYHPEASPGPHDARYLFDRFRGLVEKGC
jgi:carbamoyl-phosphate synthase small subunit